MKHILSIAITCSILLLSMHSTAQSTAISGAWESKSGEISSLLLFQDGYFTETHYKKDEFLDTKGGPFTYENGNLIVSLEFNTADSSKVGSKITIPVTINNQKLTISKPQLTTFNRVDEGKSPLAGVWKISGRKQGDSIVTIHQTGPRKTLKLLTGSRFQWFAINPDTKQFSGTGGGYFTFENGKYTEHILFFSRDNSRVGAALSFDGKIENGAWHHSGLSSKGDPIYEVWSKIK